jgi:pimeloyl-ACP methyl ester carboxylesterase
MRFIAGSLLALGLHAYGQMPDAQQTPAPAAGQGQTEFLVFAAGKQVGREQVSVSRIGGNWIITSSGRLTAPVEITLNRFEAKYTADWQPLELHVDAVMGGKPVALATSFGLTTAVNEITQGGATTSKTDQISARSIILPNNFFAAYEALAARLATAAPGTEIPVYVAPQTEIKAAVKAVTADQLKGPAGTLNVRKFDLSFQNPAGAVPVSLTTDAAQRVVRIEIPSAGFSVVRADAASVSVRSQVTRNPTDTDVTIPAHGFSLAATITTPPAVAGRLRHPVVILVAGSGPMDRDENVAGIQVFTQLAGALANDGFLVVRYDKRGIGQSGGRIERVTLEDYAEDVRAVVTWARKRSDVDKSRVIVAGHSEGGTVGMIAAAKTEDISRLVLIATPGTTGFDLILEQQQHGLDLMGVDAEQRKTQVDMQQRIQTAVITGVGWEGVSPELRKRADTTIFKSLLAFDPARVIPRVRQPILIVQGALDKQVPPHHAEKLAALARARKRQSDVEVVHLPGVNHLLVPATSGEVSEYAMLSDKKVVPDVVKRIAEWAKE